MSQDSTNDMPLTSREQLIEAIALGEKPEEAWRIGTEHEKFPFYTKDLSPVGYFGHQGIGALLKQIQANTGNTPILDRGEIIGLALKDGGSISLEPGGQFELSGAPLETIHQTCGEIQNHLDCLKTVAEPLGIGFLGAGALPIPAIDDVPVMPKQRYEIMRNYMPKVGTDGVNMMFRSCTVQVNLDFSSEADMVKKLRASLALQPLVTALFAASPFLDDKPTGYLSTRGRFWRNLDPSRTGMLPFVFEDGFGYERYVDWALDVPLYFLKRGDTYIDVTGSSFRDLLSGDFQRLPSAKATVGDWQSHLSTLFPEARLKSFIEMRGADAGPHAFLCALSAVWVGLLYHKPSLDAVHDLIKTWTQADRDQLYVDAPQLGLKTEIRGQSLADIAKDVLSTAQTGLKARNRCNLMGETEAIYLTPLWEVLSQGQTIAERWLSLYHSTWNGDLKQLYREESYW